jgi:tetratricopeptide (TPR) repeat protein
MKPGPAATAGVELHALLERAARLQQAGDVSGAYALCEEALARSPRFAPALQMGANLAYQRGDLEQAEALGRRAVDAAPNEANAYYLLGNVLRTLNRPQEAIASFQRAVALRPDFHSALNNLGNALRLLERTQEAADCYRRAVALKPDYALAIYNLANIERDAGRHARAIELYRRAIGISPEYFEALNNLGNSLKDLDRLEEAVSIYERALRVNPDSPEALNNLGNVLKDLNRLKEAAVYFEKAVRVAPDFAEPHFGRSLVLLALDDYERGWDEYEWRWKSKEFPSYRWVFSEPEWHGEDLEGRTILLHCEQGFGDNLQCLRYVPMVHARGGRIVLEMPRPLVPIARTVRCPIETMVVVGEKRPHFDLRCSMMSLPHVFRSTLDTLPREVPYLFPDPELVERWRARIGDAPGPKVGIVWAGNPRQPTEVKRGIGLDGYRPLLSLPGIRWFSLQVGPRARDLDRLPPGLVTDLSNELTDFAQTAAAMRNLDLVITTDTSVAHLAGALAHPVWVLLRFSPDWRWGLGREDNAWYPTLRLFRQAAIDDWRAPVAALRSALEGELARSVRA